jgi:hypothetical protein
VFYNATLLGTYGTDQLGIGIGRDPRKYNSNNYGYIAKGILRTQADVDAVLSKNPNYLIGGQKPQVGFLDFEDINGDGKIDDFDITTMFDKTTAITVFGFTFNVSYKEFRLQANVNLRVGGKVFYDGEARKVPTTTQIIGHLKIRMVNIQEPMLRWQKRPQLSGRWMAHKAGLTTQCFLTRCQREFLRN